MSDKNFNFNFNFNDIDKLVFSVGTTLGTYSINSAITINPSIHSSAIQNVINVYYTDTGKESYVQAVITSISVMKDFKDTTRYAVVLSGNIVTLPNAMIYIVIPFISAASNNGTPNSASIEQIIISANTQIVENQSNTSLSSKCSLNNLISPASRYFYKYNKNSTGIFNNNANYNTTFVIYKDDPGMISNKYSALIQLLDKPANTISSSNFMTNIFTPLVQTTPNTNEIMIDCAPVDITTPSGNVLLTSDDKIFGFYEKTETNMIVLEAITGVILLAILIFACFRLVNYMSGVNSNKPPPANSPA
jgi:hypothetical protein